MNYVMVIPVNGLVSLYILKIIVRVFLTIYIYIYWCGAWSGKHTYIYIYIIQTYLLYIYVYILQRRGGREGEAISMKLFLQIYLCSMIVLPPLPLIFSHRISCIVVKKRRHIAIILIKYIFLQIYYNNQCKLTLYSV